MKQIMNSDHVRQLVADVKNGAISRENALSRAVVEVAKGRVNHAQGCLKPLLEIIPTEWGGDLVVSEPISEVKKTVSGNEKPDSEGN